MQGVVALDGGGDEERHIGKQPPLVLLSWRTIATVRQGMDCIPVCMLPAYG